MARAGPLFIVLTVLALGAGASSPTHALAAGGVDACAIVVRGDAALVLGTNPVVERKTQPSATFSTCVYRPSPGGRERLSITVNTAAKGSYRHVLGKIGNTTFAPVSGLGDRGYMATGPQKIHLGVQRGKTILALDFSGQSNAKRQEALRRIARAGLGRLP